MIYNNTNLNSSAFDESTKKNISDIFDTFAIEYFLTKRLLKQRDQIFFKKYQFLSQNYSGILVIKPFKIGMNYLSNCQIVKYNNFYSSHTKLNVRNKII